MGSVEGSKAVWSHEWWNHDSVLVQHDSVNAVEVFPEMVVFPQGCWE